MLIKRIVGCTRTVGQSQGFLGLPVRDCEVNDTVLGRCKAMKTAWEPTPKEIDKILAGEPIIVTIIGTGHPPIMLKVGDEENSNEHS